jgi:hypothetical protein
MKKIIVSLSLFLSISIVANCQLEKGNWLLGGNTSFSASKSTHVNSVYSQTSNRIDFSVSPNIGFFPSNKFAIGIKPSFTLYKDQIEGGLYSNIKRFVVGPFARYYFLEIDKEVNIVAEASYQYGFYSFKPTKGKINIFSFVAGPVIFLNNSVGLEFLMGYYSRIDDIESSYKQTQKSFQINIGLQIHLEAR